MKENNGQIIIEVNDCVQVVQGPSAATVGIVIGIQGQDLKLWGRSPNIEGSPGSQFVFVTPAADVMYIGKGRLRPMLKDESQRVIDKTRPTAPVAPSRMKPPQPPPKEPEPKTVPAPLPSPSKARLPQAKAEDSVAKPVIGQAVPDSESIDLRPRPTKGEDVDPELLKPQVFSGPNAREIHGTPQLPQALVQPEPTAQPAQPIAQPAQQQEDTSGRKEKVNPFRKKVQAKRKSGKARRPRAQRGSDLGIPVAASSTILQGSKGGDGLPPPTKDNAVRE